MKKTLILALIFVLALLVRLLYIGGNAERLESDELEYDRLAMNLAESKGYINSTDGLPTALRPPAYPAMLALIYKIFGHNYFLVRIIQAVISALTVCLLYLIAGKIFNRITAAFTGIFSSFYMTFVVSAGLLYTETVFTFLLVLITYLLIIKDEPGIGRFCAIGFLCGLLALTRSAGLAVPFLAIFYAAVKTKKLNLPVKKLVLAGTLLLLCFSTVVLPWTVRNYTAFGKFVPVSTNAGLNMYQAIRPVEGKYVGLGPRDEVAKESLAITNEAARNKFLIKKAVSAYKENPPLALKMFILRFLFYWNIIDWEITGGDVINYYYLFILPFAILGTIYSIVNRKDVFLILLVILYVTSAILVFQGTPRYRMPIDGYIIMLGCYGIYELLRRKRNRVYPVVCTITYFAFTYLAYKYPVPVKAFIRQAMQGLGLW